MPLFFQLSWADDMVSTRSKGTGKGGKSGKGGGKKDGKKGKKQLGGAVKKGTKKTSNLDLSEPAAASSSAGPVAGGGGGGGWQVGIECRFS